MATTTGAQGGVTLNDASLFRQACYVNGSWVQARSGGTIDVDTTPGVFTEFIITLPRRQR